MAFCFSCCQEFDGQYDVCPNCGGIRNVDPKQSMHLLPGTELGPKFGNGKRYIVDTAVGEGGFGIVYRAWDKKLKVIIAVKEFFSAKIASREFGKNSIIVREQSIDEFEYRRERFLAEAQYMAKFTSHENIVNVYDCFEENNTLYLTMELLEGVDLEKYLQEKDGKLSKEELLKVFYATCNALSSMHDEGIIHRDVSPSNIFLCNSGKIKLLDIGSAKLSGTDDNVVDVVSKSGYSPIEQYKGQTDSIGPYTDVYALGATMYRCLVGQRPCISTDREKKDNLPAPHSIKRKIPKKISIIIMRAMAVDPKDRYSDVSELRDAVENYIKKEKSKKTFGINYKKHASYELLVATFILLGYGLLQGVNFVQGESSITLIAGYLVLTVSIFMSKKKLFYGVTTVLAFFTTYISVNSFIDNGYMNCSIEELYDYLFEDETISLGIFLFMSFLALSLLFYSLSSLLAIINIKKIAYRTRRIANVLCFVYVVSGAILGSLFSLVYYFENNEYACDVVNDSISSGVEIFSYNYSSGTEFVVINVVFCALSILSRIFLMAGLNDSIKWLCYDNDEDDR